MEDVVEIHLARRGIDDGLDGNVEERQGKKEDEYQDGQPQERYESHTRIIQRYRAGASISACRDCKML